MKTKSKITQDSGPLTNLGQVTVNLVRQGIKPVVHCRYVDLQREGIKNAVNENGFPCTLASIGFLSTSVRAYFEVVEIRKKKGLFRTYFYVHIYTVNVRKGESIILKSGLVIPFYKLEEAWNNEENIVRINELTPLRKLIKMVIGK